MKFVLTRDGGYYGDYLQWLEKNIGPHNVNDDSPLNSYVGRGWKFKVWSRFYPGQDLKYYTIHEFDIEDDKLAAWAMLSLK